MSTDRIALVNLEDPDHISRDKKIYDEYSRSKAGSKFLEDANIIIDTNDLLEDDFHEGIAAEILDYLDDEILMTRSKLQALRDFRDGYTDALGVPAALLVAASALQDGPSREWVSIMRRNLELMAGSRSSLPLELREALRAIGMPTDYRLAPVVTYSDAAATRPRAWPGCKFEDVSPQK